MAISILIAGDFVIRQQSQIMIDNLDVSGLLGFMESEIKGCDLSIVNLEAPVVTKKTLPITKCGPALSTTSKVVQFLGLAGFNLLTLANNHFRDYGDHGVFETIKASKDNNINIVGGGANIKDARQIFYFQKEQSKLAIINVCEHEYSIASNDHGGANPLDLINLYEDIKEAKKKATFVIIIVHGGVEHYQLPTPRMKKWYHHIIDLGADAVINHHQHCFSGFEIYKEKPIAYGLGNFVFDNIYPNKTMKSWHEGYAVKLNVDKKIELQLIPYEQGYKKIGVAPKDMVAFNKEITHLNEIIADDNKLLSSFEQYVFNNKYSILSYTWLWSNRYLKALYKRGFLGNIYNNNGILAMQNKTTCESHLDTLQLLTECIVKNIDKK